MPLVQKGGLSNVYTTFESLVPGLRARVTEYPSASGPICEHVHIALHGQATVLSLGINKIRPGVFMALIQDVTRAVAREERIRADRERLNAIFENIRDYAIYTVDRNGYVEEWNRSLQRFAGWLPGDVVGKSIDIFVPEGEDGHTRNARLLCKARERGSAEMEGWRVRKNGSAFWASTVATSLPDSEGRSSRFVLVTRDLSKRKRIEDKLLAMACTDPLTGTHNRRAGEAEIADAFRLWRKSSNMFSIMALDADHFKSINDRFGHDCGDEVLLTITRICRDTLRTGDSVIRWGGEEFILLLPDAHCHVAQTIGERLREAIQNAETGFAGHCVKITVSIGIAAPQAGDADVADMLRRADQAMYAAKQAGRNRVTCGGCPTR
jgi:diguanylate cyclase (GGDEF)-like protein/PAS domain S-box-containing protein